MGQLVKDEWVIKVNDELKQIKDCSADEMEQYWKKRCIYRLPACVTELNKTAYKPQAVSFGPYHHGQEQLRPMEEHKSRALFRFLKRSKRPLVCYIESLASVVQDLKDSYDSLDESWQEDTDAFLQLMILDGCFMLEILHKAASVDDPHQAWKSSNRLGLDDDDYASNDPIFSDHGKLYIMPYIKRDMLMIENQLPMMLLHNLLAVQNDEGKHEEEFINNLILKFYSNNPPVSSMGKCLHVLDLYRKSLLFEDRHKNSQRPRLETYGMVHEGNNKTIRSAVELNEGGIQFRKSKTGSLEDISFHRGVLRLPCVIVDDATESMFLNLIAFEKFHAGAGKEVTSYIFLMDNIIVDAKDVTLLNSQGIIQNAFGTDKDVAKLFNSLSKDITLEQDNSLDIVHKNLNNYCRKPWNEWRANLIRNYFRNPWAMLSVVAANFLFVLAIIQTIYTVYPNYKSG